MSRTPTPSIMDELTLTKPDKIEQESNKAIKPAFNKAVEQESIKPIKQPKSKAVPQESNKDLPEEAKEKATFNLTIDTLETLEDACIRLKRQLKGAQRVTKTLFVEKALEIALDDLATNGNESEIFKKLR